MEQCTLCPAAREIAAKKRYRTLLHVAEEVVGVKMDRTRAYRSVLIRRMVAVKMVDEDFRVGEVAEAMGMNHATIHHYIQQMRDCRDEPIFYAKELDLYFKFLEYVRDEDAIES